MDDNDKFQKIIDDFVRDLLISYPEYEETFSVIDYGEYYNFCKEVYPERFFNILYENDELFESEEPVNMLPGIDFVPMFRDKSLSEPQRKLYGSTYSWYYFVCVRE